MRFWLPLLLFVIAFVAVVVFALLYMSEEVHLQYGGWRASVPLSVAMGSAMLAIVAAVLALKLLAFLFSLPLRMVQWDDARREKKERRQFQEVVRMVAFGDQSGLLKALTPLATDNTAAAWRAAEIATEEGNAKGAAKWLIQVADSDDEVLAAAAKAEICRRDERLSEAVGILENAGALRGPALLTRKLHEISEQRGDWEMALSAAMKLREKSPRWQHVIENIVMRYFAQAQTADEAARFWKDKVAAKDKKRIALLAVYIGALRRLGADKKMKEELAQAFKQYRQDATVLEMVAAFGDNAQCEAAFAAAEQQARDNDPRILNVLVQLAQRLQLPGKETLYRQQLGALDGSSLRVNAA